MKESYNIIVMKCIKLYILQLHVMRRRDSLTNFNKLFIDVAIDIKRRPAHYRGPILEQISHMKIAIPYTTDQLQSRNCHFHMRKLFIYAQE